MGVARFCNRPCNRPWHRLVLTSVCRSCLQRPCSPLSVVRSVRPSALLWSVGKNACTLSVALLLLSLDTLFASRCVRTLQHHSSESEHRSQVSQLSAMIAQKDAELAEQADALREKEAAVAGIGRELWSCGAELTAAQQELAKQLEVVESQVRALWPLSPSSGHLPFPVTMLVRDEWCAASIWRLTRT